MKMDQLISWYGWWSLTGYPVFKLKGLSINSVKWPTVDFCVTWESQLTEQNIKGKSIFTKGRIKIN